MLSVYWCVQGKHNSEVRSPCIPKKTTTPVSQHCKDELFFVINVSVPFHLILSNYGECYQKERNVKYVWSAVL